MEVWVKNQVLTKKYISRFAFNSTRNILACIADACDSILFYLYLPDHSFVEIFNGISKPSGKKCSIVWSPDGTTLALGSSTLELWKLIHNKIVPLKTYSEDFVDIKVIAWSPDSLSIAYGGLSKKNTIKVRNLQNNTHTDISIPLTISSISYDPFGKYLLLLVHNNIIYVYNSNSLTKIRQIPLSPKATSMEITNTVKEIRVMGWSPDFNDIVCPSLDDSKIALAINFSRNQNFITKNIFTGHVSSISCAKFNPNLYEYEGIITSILALGDSHGVISFWRLSATKKFQEPLLISNSHSESCEVVEQFEWNQLGDILIVNMMKRYINILRFNKESFGKQVSLQSKIYLIQSIFGAKSASQINKKNLEIFSFFRSSRETSETIANNVQLLKNKSQCFDSTIQIKNKQQTDPKAPIDKQIEVNTIEAALSQQNGKNPQILNQSQGLKRGQKIQYVKINEQITTKDKNNRKKIQPAILMRKDQLPKASNLPNQNTSNFCFQNQPTTYSNCFEPLKLKPIQLETRFSKIMPNFLVQIKKIQGFSIIQLSENKDFQKIIVSERVYTGNIDFMIIKKKLIYLLNLGNLSILDHNLNIFQLPYAIGDIHKISINNEGDIYYINTKGFIRGFNHLKNKCYVPQALPIQHLLEAAKINLKDIPENTNQDDKEDQFDKCIEEFQVQKDHNIYITLLQNKERYFYNRQTGNWISLAFNMGLVKKGHSLKVTESEEKLISDYFKSITSKLLQQQSLIQKKLGSYSPHQQQYQSYESNMIYYKKHNPNRQFYKQNLLNMLKQMKAKNQTSKLRNAINKYFIDKKSQVYQNDPTLLQKVRQIGGTVIEQFMLFDQL